jgi:hypothetical protein
MYVAVEPISETVVGPEYVRRDDLPHLFCDLLVEFSSLHDPSRPPHHKVRGSSGRL